ncbi:MAG: polysaccharide biosynthesis/export family protein [Cyanobacterium sp. T60_A2020_053]|nr:polysaccharide biosynthesis/export family protein [Cyanobacterium sp. T60_A2020_053]
MSQFIRVTKHGLSFASFVSVVLIPHLFCTPSYAQSDTRQDLPILSPNPLAPSPAPVTPTVIPSNTQVNNDTTFNVVPQGYQPPPFNEQESLELNEYRLDFGDVIAVNVLRFPEFNFSAALDAKGNVIAPLLGRISLKGLTIEEVENKIRLELGNRFLKEPPQVVAALTGQRPVNLTVVGEVGRPGYYTIGQGTPLNIVLAQAGGTTQQADIRSIIIKRTLHDGTIVEEKVNLYQPLIEGKRQPQVRLQAGDTIVVSRLQVGEDQDYDRLFVSRTNIPDPVITVRLVAPTGAAGVTLRNINIPNGSSFLDAVALLPEFVPLITNNEVSLVRFDPELGRVVTQSLNVRETIQNSDVTQNVPLRDDDVIVVSRTLLGRVLGGIRIITQPIRDIFGFTDFIQRTFDGSLFDRRNNFRF